MGRLCFTLNRIIGLSSRSIVRFAARFLLCYNLWLRADLFSCAETIEVPRVRISSTFSVEKLVRGSVD